MAHQAPFVERQVFSSWLRLLRNEQIVDAAANGVEGRGLRYTAVRASITSHHILTVVALGEMSIVDSAEQGDVLRFVIATSAIRMAVMKLQPATFSTATTVVPYKGASTLITIVDGTLDRSWNVAGGT